MNNQPRKRIKQEVKALLLVIAIIVMGSSVLHLKQTISHTAEVNALKVELAKEAKVVYLDKNTALPATPAEEEGYFTLAQAYVVDNTVYFKIDNGYFAAKKINQYTDQDDTYFNVLAQRSVDSDILFESYKTVRESGY